MKGLAMPSSSCDRQPGRLMFREGMRASAFVSGALVLPRQTPWGAAFNLKSISVKSNHANVKRRSRPYMMSAASTPDSAESGADASESGNFGDLPALPAASGSEASEILISHLRTWRDFRAKLVANERAQSQKNNRYARKRFYSSYDNAFYNHSPVWVHNLSRIEVGSCLIASKAHTWPNSADYLQHAVVLITDIDPVSGVQGLILNRPTARRVNASPGVLARVGAEFKENIVHLGGDCCMGFLEVLHSRPDVSGAREVIPGIFRGGINSCRDLVSNGLASPSDFHMIISYTRWTWQQLSEEMDFNAWHIAAVSSNLLLYPFLETSRSDSKELWNIIMRELNI